MELKAKLNKPYTQEQKNEFIIAQNRRLGYEIRFVADGLEAWGKDNAELLAGAKEAKLNELRTARDAEENKPVTTDKGEFDFDELSQRRINNAIALTGDEETRNWTLVNGEIVEVTKADLLEVVKTGAIRSDDDHNKWLALEELVNEATTVEEVEAIKWDDLEPNNKVVDPGNDLVNRQ